jgi:uncharacterized repeat protein (TIGR03803 family)
MKFLRLLALVLPVLTFAATTAPAQTYTVLDNLGINAGDPLNPAWIGTFAQGRDGNLYSTTPGGGAKALGTVFQLTPSGSLKVLHSFDDTDGAFPNSGLTLGTDGNLYGTTSVGGLGFGTVFRITTGGTFKVLHSFDGISDGEEPNAPPIQGPDGDFYGTTSNGGGEVFGTVYKMTPSGSMKVLFTFDGSVRYPEALTLGTDGNFYGTALGGSGLNANGFVFKISPNGKFAVLHSFNLTDGQRPMGAIIQASDGNFYGTTEKGGAGGFGAVYQMTPAGTLTDIHSFNEDGFGLLPVAGLVQATDGKFYGVAGNDIGHGVLFQITSTGTYSIVLNFTNIGGAFPGASAQVALLQNTNGILYGDTDGGGTGTLGCVSCGVLYSLNLGLNPFVTFLPPQSAAIVGTSIGILGQGLTGTRGVSFNGTSATFNVVSDTFLTATVPSGVTSGFIKVNSGGKPSSNKMFRVTPQFLSFGPPSGAVGTTVTITGVSLTQTSKITFGGVRAISVTVDSDGQLTATVPAGAVTGRINVTTRGGICQSATSFVVTP